MLEQNKFSYCVCQVKAENAGLYMCAVSSIKLSILLISQAKQREFISIWIAHSSTVIMAGFHYVRADKSSMALLRAAAHSVGGERERALH